MDNANKTSQLEEQQPENYITIKEFYQNYSGIRDEFKYEWNDGKIEKTKDMSQYLMNMFLRVFQVFGATEAYREGGGIMTQIRTKLPTNQIRLPEMAYFSKEELLQESNNGKSPAWVAEIVAEQDRAGIANKRIAEYFNGGAKSVWVILPESKKVNVFTAPDKMYVCSGPAVCSAAPAITGLEIPAEQLFT